MSLCTEDLKRLLERTDLAFQAGMAVFADDTSFQDAVLTASHQAVGSAALHEVRMVFLLFILGGELSSKLPLCCIDRSLEHVTDAIPTDCDLLFHLITDEHLDGGLCVVTVGIHRSSGCIEIGDEVR